MADDGSQQRKPDFRTAVEDVKASATVLVMKLESVLGRRLYLRSPALLAAIGVAATVVVALMVVITLLLTGGGKAVSENAALIGALIALGGVFTTQMVNSALEDRRARVNSELEDRRAGAGALQTYLERMGELLGGKGSSNANEEASAPASEMRELIRAHTLAVLEGQDPKRKGIVVQFLCESKLIPREHRDEEDKVLKEKVVDLSGANLRDADLFGLNLRKVGLDGAFLERANLREAHLPDADLGGTRLYQADLTDANLSGASLWNAHLQSRPDLGLKAANLSGANLSDANLSGANLSGANLSGANLSGVYKCYKLNSNWYRERVTNEELKAQTDFLKGATMPDGLKYEEWLKSKGRGEDGKNSGPS